MLSRHIDWRPAIVFSFSLLIGEVNDTARQNSSTGNANFSWPKLNPSSSCGSFIEKKIRGTYWVAVVLPLTSFNFKETPVTWPFRVKIMDLSFCTKNNPIVSPSFQGRSAVFKPPSLYNCTNQVSGQRCLLQHFLSLFSPKFQECQLTTKQTRSVPNTRMFIFEFKFFYCAIWSFGGPSTHWNFSTSKSRVSSRFFWLLSFSTSFKCASLSTSWASCTYCIFLSLLCFLILLFTLLFNTKLLCSSISFVQHFSLVLYTSVFLLSLHPSSSQSINSSKILLYSNPTRFTDRRNEEGGSVTICNFRKVLRSTKRLVSCAVLIPRGTRHLFNREHTCNELYVWKITHEEERVFEIIDTNFLEV